MNKCFFLILMGLSALATSQDLRSINYRHLYDPDQPISLNVSLARNQQEIVVIYETQSQPPSIISWEVRDNLSDREGQLVETTETAKGIIKIDINHLGKILVAKFKTGEKKEEQVYYRLLKASALPEFFFSEPKNFIKRGNAVLVQPPGSAIVSYFSTTFPPAPSPHNVSPDKANPILKADSAFTISTTDPIVLNQKGLYLFQRDTSKAEGKAWRVEEDFPKYATLENLIDPLVYVCTKQEFEKLKQSKGDKKAFDKTILTITGNTERAKIFIRNYFRRVELANQFFSSYKEGWKTDRGMIYIIFGLPEEVFRFSDREIWDYKINGKKFRFQFAKTSTIFDPENFVLIRDKKYMNTWYETIDLWRKARF